MLSKCIKSAYNGEEMYLAYTVNAMFQINDLKEDSEELLSILDAKGKEGIERFCEIIEILARNGATAREVDGFVRSFVPEAKKMASCMVPFEYIRLKKDALNTILAGYGREITNPEEEIDLELAELEKKGNPPEQKC